MTANDIHVLDSMRVEEADVEVNKYHWTVGGDSGVKAYLDTGYFVVTETNLDNKWGDIYSGTPEEIEAAFEEIVNARMKDG